MRNPKDTQHSDRRTASAEAKAAMLKAFETARNSDASGKAARLAERAATALAREERRVERERAKFDEQARTERAKAERHAAEREAALAAADAKKNADKDLVARAIEDEAARKAARDLRYANRKARKS